MKELTKRQNEILTFVKKFISSHSYPPTIREIAENFSISVKGAHDHITALRKKGAVKHTGKCSRTLELVKSYGDNITVSFRKIPYLGTVAAGRPIFSDENYDGSIAIEESLLKRQRKYFALKVKGDSMRDAGIMEGDTALIEIQNVVKNGEIAVVAIEEAVTLKRFFKETSRIKLQAENPDYKPIYCRDVRVLGRLSLIMRSY